MRAMPTGWSCALSSGSDSTICPPLAAAPFSPSQPCAPALAWLWAQQARGSVPSFPSQSPDVTHKELMPDRAPSSAWPITGHFHLPLLLSQEFSGSKF